MSDAELHIHIPGPFAVEKLDKLLNEAIALKDDGQIRAIVPTGYKCVECYSDDGGHSVTCSVYRSQKRGATHE